MVCTNSSQSFAKCCLFFFFKSTGYVINFLGETCLDLQLERERDRVFWRYQTIAKENYQQCSILPKSAWSWRFYFYLVTKQIAASLFNFYHTRDLTGNWYFGSSGYGLFPLIGMNVERKCFTLVISLIPHNKLPIDSDWSTVLIKIVFSFLSIFSNLTSRCFDSW